MRPRDQRPYNVAYYQRNRDQEIARVRTRQIATTEFLRDLRRVPCADCGRSFEPVQMEFDHRDPATKSFMLTQGRAMLRSREALLAEAAKCDVVCAICHRIRTRALNLRRSRSANPKRWNMPSQAPKKVVWERNRLLLRALRNHACADCGRRYPPFTMDFDHRDPTTKGFVVTTMRWKRTAGEILVEADKCDIVCANCHRLRTYNRRQAERLGRE